MESSGQMPNAACVWDEAAFGKDGTTAGKGAERCLASDFLLHAVSGTGPVGRGQRRRLRRDRAGFRQTDPPFARGAQGWSEFSFVVLWVDGCF